MKVLILGASGIVGQMMRLYVPAGVEPRWYRRTPDMITDGGDLTQNIGDVTSINPDVIVNLSGESNVDTVERDEQTWTVNVALPSVLAEWCQTNGRKYIHVSSQAVFSGSQPPYRPRDRRRSVNKYGWQKIEAEDAVFGQGAVIVRLSTIFGIRPLPHVGRRNPLEAILAGQSPQVCDRWFSPLIAQDAAQLLWNAVLHAKAGDIIHCGDTETWSRYMVNLVFGDNCDPCKSDHFPDLAPRPIDTTYAKGSQFIHSIRELPAMIEQQKADDRAIELALFFGINLDAAKEKLEQGFGPLHNAVTEDFRRVNPVGESGLIDWYRTTEAYIWELSAYHLDGGFAYDNTMQSIQEILYVAGLEGRPGINGTRRVLAIGDGIGDVTLSLHRAGLDAYYHDLLGSRTAEYARFRFWRQTGQELRQWALDPATPTVNPEDTAFDAIISLDFLEHVTDVEAWVREIYRNIKPGGLFCAQNAFAMGSGPLGDMPMHLACNDRYEFEWDALLTRVGFRQISSNWYERI